MGSASRARKFKNALTAGILGAVGGIAAVETGSLIVYFLQFSNFRAIIKLNIF